MDVNAEIYAAVLSMRTVARGSDALAGDESASRVTFTNEAALRQIHAIAERALERVDAAQRQRAQGHVALADPAPQSSVEIESRVKGPPGVKVKVYAHDPHIAKATARELYDETVGEYAERARVTEQEAVDGHV